MRNLQHSTDQVTSSRCSKTIEEENKQSDKAEVIAQIDASNLGSSSSSKISSDTESVENSGDTNLFENISIRCRHGQYTHVGRYDIFGYGYGGGIGFSSSTVDITPRGEGAEYLSPFIRVVGGDITLNRRSHTARVQVFAGSRARNVERCEALFDTGSPASFIQKKWLDRMLECGSASIY